jgi:tetratricopeptide (TPR) repeat protein
MCWTKKIPDSPTVPNLRGQTYLLKKDLPNARANFERALSLNPTFFPAAASLAKLDLDAQKIDDARKRFEAILAKDPKNVQAMLALGGITPAYRRHTTKCC